MRTETSSIASRALLVTVLLALVASPVAAQANERPAWAADAYDDATTLVEKYNENVDGEDLGTAGDQLTGEVVNLHVEGPDGATATFAFEMTDDHEIENLSRGTRDDATMKMVTDRATYRRIATANNPAAAFQSSVRNGDVRIHGLGAVNAVKWGTINVAADVARGLGNAF